MCQILEVASEELEESVSAEAMQGHAALQMKLHMRATHVFGESGRVFSFKNKAGSCRGAQATDE